jgi:hypothetical protein
LGGTAGVGSGSGFLLGAGLGFPGRNQGVPGHGPPQRPPHRIEGFVLHLLPGLFGSPVVNQGLDPKLVCGHLTVRPAVPAGATLQDVADALDGQKLLGELGSLELAPALLGNLVDRTVIKIQVQVRLVVVEGHGSPLGVGGPAGLGVGNIVDDDVFQLRGDLVDSGCLEVVDPSAFTVIRHHFVDHLFPELKSWSLAADLHQEVL